MNFNAVFAVLVLKNIITQDEAQAVVDYLHDKPQSTVLADTIDAVKGLLVPTTALMPQLGPVGPAQREEEIAARSAAAVAPTPPADSGPVSSPDPAEAKAANDAGLKEPGTEDEQPSEPNPPVHIDKQENEQKANTNDKEDAGDNDKTETDKSAKSTSVNKSTSTSAKK